MFLGESDERLELAHDRALKEKDDFLNDDLKDDCKDEDVLEPRDLLARKESLPETGDEGRVERLR